MEISKSSTFDNEKLSYLKPLQHEQGKDENDKVSLTDWVGASMSVDQLDESHTGEGIKDPLGNMNKSPPTTPTSKMKQKEEEWMNVVSRSSKAGTPQGSPRSTPRSSQSIRDSDHSYFDFKVRESIHSSPAINEEESVEDPNLETSLCRGDNWKDMLEVEGFDEATSSSVLALPTRSLNGDIAVSVVPEWKPRSDFCFPVNRLQIRHPLQSYIRQEDLKGNTFISRGTRVDISKAEMKATGDKVVIKMLRKESMQNAIATQEHITECGLLARINHPNIVKLVGAGISPRPFLVLEMLSGGTLAAVLKSEMSYFSIVRRNIKRRTFGERLLQIRELAEALDYLHSRCHPEAIIIHRDLKPDNVGFTDDGTLKLFDLGLCTCVIKPSICSQKYEMTRNTGSTRYMAPEVALGKPYNEKVDVYSFGILAWQMVGGSVPFDGFTAIEFSSRVFENHERPVIDSVWPTLFSNILERSWDLDPEKRPTMETIVNELTNLVQQFDF